jgi:hypothetical protein
MHEREDVKIRRFLRVWKNRQLFASSLLVVSLIPSIITLAWFLTSPSVSAVCIMLGCLTVMTLFCVRMLVATSRIVELKRLLPPCLNIPHLEVSD